MAAQDFTAPRLLGPATGLLADRGMGGLTVIMQKPE